MKKPFKKSTIEDIEQMFKWHKAGVSTNEIGRRLKKDHASVIYWLKKSPEYIKGISGRIPLLKVPKDVGVDKFLAKKEAEEEIRNSGKCLVCRKEKADKWAKTFYCSLKCFGLAHDKEHKSPIY